MRLLLLTSRRGEADAWNGLLQGKVTLSAMGAFKNVSSLLRDFAAGIMILLYRPYDMGDTVTVAGIKGNVTSMSLVSTVLKNADGHTVTVPNSSIWGGTITNHGVAWVRRSSGAWVQRAERR